MLTSTLTPLCAAPRAPFADFTRISDAFQIVAECAAWERLYGSSTLADSVAADAAYLFNLFNGGTF